MRRHLIHRQKVDKTTSKKTVMVKGGPKKYIPCLVPSRIIFIFAGGDLSRREIRLFKSRSTK